MIWAFIGNFRVWQLPFITSPFHMSLPDSLFEEAWLLLQQ